MRLINAQSREKHGGFTAVSYTHLDVYKRQTAMQVDEGNHVLMSKEEIENKIATFTGGRAAEEVVFGSVTTGASKDVYKRQSLFLILLGHSRIFYIFG